MLYIVVTKPSNDAKLGIEVTAREVGDNAIKFVVTHIADDSLFKADMKLGMTLKTINGKGFSSVEEFVSLAEAADSRVTVGVELPGIGRPPIGEIGKKLYKERQKLARDKWKKKQQRCQQLMEGNNADPSICAEEGGEAKTDELTDNYTVGGILSYAKELDPEKEAFQALVYTICTRITLLFEERKAWGNGEGRGGVRVITKRSVIEKLVEDYKPRWPALTVELIESELCKQERETELNNVMQRMENSAMFANIDRAYDEGMANANLANISNNRKRPPPPQEEGNAEEDEGSPPPKKKTYPKLCAIDDCTNFALGRTPDGSLRVCMKHGAVVKKRICSVDGCTTGVNR